MSTEIIVALIAGFAGVVGGIIAWVQAIKTSRLKADADATLEWIKSEANIGLEKMKAENERRRKAFELATQESKPIETALAQAWHDIQTIKEVISKLLTTVPYDLDLIRKDFSPAHAKISEGYASWGPELPESARIAWHKAKSHAQTVELTLASAYTTNDGVRDFAPKIIENLREIRVAFTDCQMILASSRQTIREKTIRQLLEVL